MSTEPRSKLDIIYQEVLGEVSQLVGQLDIVSSRIQRLAEARRPPVLLLVGAFCAALLGGAVAVIAGIVLLRWWHVF
jgi:hypothetical protein